MANHVTGTSVPASILSSCLSELCQPIRTALLGNSRFREAAQLQANYFVHEGEEIARLTRWRLNVLVEIARHKATAARQRCRLLLPRQRPLSFRGQRPPQPRPALAWGPGSPLPDRADRRASPVDLHAAVRFQPVDSLTGYHLLSPRPQ